MRPTIRLRLMKGVYSDNWILAAVVDGFPKWFAKYATGEDALKAVRITLDNEIFVGYPFEQFRDASFRPSPEFQFRPHQVN